MSLTDNQMAALAELRAADLADAGEPVAASLLGRTILDVQFFKDGYALLFDGGMTAAFTIGEGDGVAMTVAVAKPKNREGRKRG